MVKFWRWMRREGYSIQLERDQIKQRLLGYMIEYIMYCKKGGWSHINPIPIYRAKSVSDLYRSFKYCISHPGGDKYNA
jgi:hypothetical protein